MIPIHPKEDFDICYETHVSTVYRLCFSFMRNDADAQDAVQETFLKLLQQKKLFENQEHVKAWLIVTASNYCKNNLKHWWRKNQDIGDYEESLHVSDEPTSRLDLLTCILGLPTRYKTVVFLYYYEGYDSQEIAHMLHKPASTIRSHLHDARRLLKDALQED